MPNSRLWYSIISLFVAFALLFTIGLIYQKHQQPHSQPPKNGQQDDQNGGNDRHNKQDNRENKDQNQDKNNDKNKNQDQRKSENSRLLWGVDTASRVTESFYQCVTDHYGKPDVWGRYMETTEDVSLGLTQEEVSLIHKKDGKILLLYNHLDSATGYEDGKAEAETAISFAKELGVPEGTALFADIEPVFPVDADFIRGWIEKMASSPYKAGFYGDFSKGSSLRKAYHSAIEETEHKPVLWSFQPRIGITGKEDAPNDFDPAAPKSAKTLAWQYGVSGEQCNIDTDLAVSKILKYLW
ncbi:MAG TPA: glycoside hydrolase domain-containing protein [Bacillales bacterium]|nr:glycoside hydrolase domain-containing protein [Bacillales bacterium]